MRTSTFRLDDDSLDRADRLIPRVASSGLVERSTAGTPRVSRSSVLRLALVRGLEALELDLKKKPARA